MKVVHSSLLTEANSGEIRDFRPILSELPVLGPSATRGQPWDEVAGADSSLERQEIH